MRSIVRRSAFAGALCTGVAMVGASMYGLVGVDDKLARSAAAARQLDRPPLELVRERPPLRVVIKRACPAPAPRV